MAALRPVDRNASSYFWLPVSKERSDRLSEPRSAHAAVERTASGDSPPFCWMAVCPTVSATMCEVVSVEIPVQLLEDVTSNRGNMGCGEYMNRRLHPSDFATLNAQDSVPSHRERDFRENGDSEQQVGHVAHRRERGDPQPGPLPSPRESPATPPESPAEGRRPWLGSGAGRVDRGTRQPIRC